MYLIRDCRQIYDVDKEAVIFQLSEGQHYQKCDNIFATKYHAIIFIGIVFAKFLSGIWSLDHFRIKLQDKGFIV